MAEQSFPPKSVLKKQASFQISLGVPEEFVNPDAIRSILAKGLTDAGLAVVEPGQPCSSFLSVKVVMRPTTKSTTTGQCLSFAYVMTAGLYTALYGPSSSELYCVWQDTSLNHVDVSELSDTISSEVGLLVDRLTRDLKSG